MYLLSLKSLLVHLRGVPMQPTIPIHAQGLVHPDG